MHTRVDVAELARLLDVALPELAVTPEEVTAALRPVAPTAHAPWVARVAAGAPATDDLETLAELAAEAPGGPLAAIHTLLAGLMLRHADDGPTVAALAAVLDLHLPEALARARGE